MEGVGSNRCFKVGGGNSSVWLPFSSGSSEAKSEQDTKQFNSFTGGDRVDNKGNSQNYIGKEFGVGGYRGSLSKEDQTCEQIETGSKERTQKVSVSMQPETSKFSLPNKSLQIRGPQHSNQVVEERVVDVHFQPQGGLFSCGHSPRLNSLSGNSLDGKLVQVPGAAIWSQPFTMGVYKSGERDGQVLEEEGDCSGSLFGRFLDNGSNQGGGIEGPFGNRAGFEEVGLVKGADKRVMGAEPKSGILGFDPEFGVKFGGNTGGKDSVPSKEGFRVAEVKEGNCQNGSQCGRNSAEPCPSIFTCKTVHSQFLSSIEGFSKENLGMGRRSVDQLTAKKRLELDSEKFGEFQRKSNVETSCHQEIGVRCFTDRLGFQVRINEGRESLEQERKFIAHQRIGTVGHSQGVGDSSITNSREVNNADDRQHYSHEQLEQWRRKERQFDSKSEGNLELVNKVGSQYLGGSLDPRKGECHSRFGKSADGLARLDFETRKISGTGEIMGSSFNRSNGIRFESQTGPFQLNPMVSRDRSFELFLSGLESGEQLRTVTSKPDSSSFATSERVSSRSNNHSSDLGGSTMVAKAVEHDSRDFQLGLGREYNSRFGKSADTFGTIGS